MINLNCEAKKWHVLHANKCHMLHTCIYSVFKVCNYDRKEDKLNHCFRTASFNSWQSKGQHSYSSKSGCCWKLAPILNDGRSKQCISCIQLSMMEEEPLPSPYTHIKKNYPKRWFSDIVKACMVSRVYKYHDIL